MALIECSFVSEKVNINTRFFVILPDKPKAKKLKTLYLLHGYTDDSSAWTRQTAIERYAEKYDIAIVMPDVYKSFYTDFDGLETGYKYFQYVSDELLEVTRRFFPLSNKREDTFVAGLSMGGFGALKLALNCPEKFSYAASFSGALIIDDLDYRLESDKEFKMILGKKGNNTKGTINNLLERATAVNKEAVKPKIYQACGTEDFLYENNIKFKKHMETLDFDYFYTEGEGAHTWDYWDYHIQKVLEWLPIKKNN